jgi:hypothetical protein
MTTLDTETGSGRKVRFTLETERVTMEDFRAGMKLKVPYWSIWPVYMEREIGRPNNLARILVWLPLPIGSVYFAITVLWLFWPLAVLFSIPVYFWWMAWRGPRRKEFYFQQDEGGGYAMQITYRVEREEEVKEFVRALLERLEQFSERRKAERDRVDEDDDDPTAE